MINVYFYKFIKKNNSTATPPVNAPQVIVPCALRESTSSISPVLIIDDSEVQQDSLFDYNYAFIQTFHRYYFINNYVYDNNTWLFFLSCDVLGSFYIPYLSGTTQHIVRTSDSSKGDVDIVDSFYKSKIGRIGSSLTNSSDLVYTKSNYSGVVNLTSWGDYFSYSTNGCYVVGIVNRDGKGLTYYRMSETVFSNFISQVLQISISMSTGSGSLNANLARAIYDPIQYIKYCKWFPINAYIPGQGVQSLYVGSQSVSLGNVDIAYIITPEKGIMLNGTLITIPKNPFSGSLRTYLSLKPYSEYNLYFPVLGMIPLDSARMYKYSKLELKWITDYTTGKTDFYIIPTNRNSLAADNDSNTYIPSDNSSAMFYSSLTMGVDVPIYNLSLDMMSGAVLTGVSWLENARHSDNNPFDFYNMFKVKEGSLADKSLNFYNGYKTYSGRAMLDEASEVLKKEMDSGIDAIASSLGQLKAQGTPNTYMTYSDTSYPFICAMFYTQESMNLQKYGMPSDFTAQLSTLGNCFIMCKSPQFNVSSAVVSPSPVITKDEQNSCMRFLENGIYIEN